MIEVPDCFYRISVKALVLNDTKDKFLLIRESSGRWELPGGGLEWGSGVAEDLQRELQEEMGLNLVNIEEKPSYFFTFQNERGVWKANVVYKTVLESLEFIPSDECVEVRFVNKDSVAGLELHSNVEKFVEIFEEEHTLLN